MKQFFPYLLSTLVLALFLSSCASRVVQTKEAKDAISQEIKQEISTKPITTEVLPSSLEVLEDFHLQIPERISIGDAFELRVTTIGALGTKPFFEDDEALEMELRSSTAKLEPTNFSIQGGIGETKVTLSGVVADTNEVELILLLNDLNQNLITKRYTLNIK